jgi:hypothetical protein
VVDEQDYCDWCYGWLSDGDRRRSRALGLPLEASWACGRCLDAGRYRRPPDGWDGPVEEWLARNVFVFTDEELLALSQALNEVLHGPDAIPQYYSRGFPVCDRAAAQRDLLFIGCGYTVSRPFGCGWLPASGCGQEPGVVVVPAGDGLVSSASS